MSSAMVRSSSAVDSPQVSQLMEDSRVTQVVPTPCRTKVQGTALLSASPDFGTPVDPSALSAVECIDNGKSLVCSSSAVENPEVSKLMVGSSVREAVPTPCRTKLQWTPISAVSPCYGTPVDACAPSAVECIANSTSRPNSAVDNRQVSKVMVDPSVKEAVPTPCRTKLQWTANSAVTPDYGSPTDPFAPSRTLLYTPPQTCKSEESQQPQQPPEQPPQTEFADAAVQTDNLDCEIDQDGDEEPEDNFGCEIDEDDDEEPEDRWLCIGGLSRCCGYLFWWMVRNSLRMIVLQALLLPCLIPAPHQSQPSVHVEDAVISSFFGTVAAPTFKVNDACFIDEEICLPEDDFSRSDSSELASVPEASELLHESSAAPSTAPPLPEDDFLRSDSSEVTLAPETSELQHELSAASSTTHHLPEADFSRPESSEVTSVPEASELQHELSAASSTTPHLPEDDILMSDSSEYTSVPEASELQRELSAASSTTHHLPKDDFSRSDSSEVTSGPEASELHYEYRWWHPFLRTFLIREALLPDALEAAVDGKYTQNHV